MTEQPSKKLSVVFAHESEHPTAAHLINVNDAIAKAGTAIGPATVVKVAPWTEKLGELGPYPDLFLHEYTVDAIPHDERHSA